MILRRHVRNVILTTLMATASLASAGSEGYYRFPAIHDKTVVFNAESDLWKTAIDGGLASRLTTHPGEEAYPVISPDGKTLAFTAQYEGPAALYTMPLDGGVPVRHTYGGYRPYPVTWLADGKLVFATQEYATRPTTMLATLDLKSGTRTLVELADAADGVYDGQNASLYFVRFPFQGSHTKRYQGGTAQNLWRYDGGDVEAVPLTADFDGTSKRPMWWKDRVYFLTDRDGTMNVWSMKSDGSDLKQETKHEGFDIRNAALSEGRILYQLGADLWLYEIGSSTKKLSIELSSDKDQEREQWIKKPMDYLSAAHLSPDGDRVVLTARGNIFVAPRKQGRLVEVTRKPGIRYREARFLPDGKSLAALSDESGEVEFWKLPANGVGAADQITTSSTILRWDGVPSPDGKWLAHWDKNQRLYLHDLKAQSDKQIDESQTWDFGNVTWSPDSQWFAYTVSAANMMGQIKLHNVVTGASTFATTDRYDSYAPSWSADGKWLYFLSDRHLDSVVGAPWGPQQPEPYFDKKTQIFQIALKKGQRSPFEPLDELHTDDKDGQDKDEKDPAKDDAKKDDKSSASPTATPAKDDEKKSEEKKDVPKVKVDIDVDGLAARLYLLPIPPGNYGNLMTTEKRIYFTKWGIGSDAKGDLMTAPIDRKDVEVKEVVADIRAVELSTDGKRMLILKDENVYIVDAPEGSINELHKNAVDLSGWTFTMVPREEWRQMYDEAWRLERDYFYDRDMHGVDWKAVREKYASMVDRVSTRAELSDVLAQMASELSALHTFVYGGDVRKGQDAIQSASLGARLERDDNAGGWVVSHIYKSDPDEPKSASPLARMGIEVAEGDIIEKIDGVDAVTAADLGQLLRNKAGKQVLLHVRTPAKKDGRDVIVTPISLDAEDDLRYGEWEYLNRLRVENESKNDIGYVHLRAMGSGDIAQWTRDFYPVFNRKGLIIDVRKNGGGNIDSWILSRLIRKAWMYWQPRVGSPYWNMQYAFRGHLVVLCDEFTGSDGEAFTEGFKRLGLGKVIGKRTWGGEIWLSSSNFLRDKGIATAAEIGVYGPEGTWLIEGRGVDPDIVVDNLPHETFKGKDRQLEAAIAHLQQQIKDAPPDVPPAPKHPDKSFKK